MASYEITAIFKDLALAPVGMAKLLGESAQDIKSFAVQDVHDNAPVDTGATQDSVQATKVNRIGPGRTGFYFDILVGDEGTVNTIGDQYPPYYEFGTYKLEPALWLSNAAQVIGAYMETSIENVLSRDLENMLDHLPEIVVSHIW